MISVPPFPSRPRAQRRGAGLRWATAALALALAPVAAGCTSGQGAAPGSTITVGNLTRTSGPTQTVTRTAVAQQPSSPAASGSPSRRPGSTGSAAVPTSVPATGSSTGKTVPKSGAGSLPAPTPLPAPRPGSCPYLPDDQLILLTGQRNGPTSVIDAAPQPICLFQRSDEGWRAAVRIFRASDPAGATAIVDAHVPVADSSPAEQPVGWTGGYMSLPDGSTDYPESGAVYGVSKCEFAVIAWTNQPQTIKARRVVLATIANLGL